jgi:hypothetical protein
VSKYLAAKQKDDVYAASQFDADKDKEAFRDYAHSDKARRFYM